MKNCIFIFICSLVTCLFGQEHQVNSDPSKFLQRGIELFHEKKYSGAINQFELYLQAAPASEVSKSETQYYIAVSKLFADNADGEAAVLNFIEKNPDSYKTDMANLALGDYYYEKKKYGRARSYYEIVKLLSIPKSEQDQFNYRLGYTQVATKKYKNAYETLKPLTTKENPHKVLATYYYGYCAYYLGKTNEAITAFKSVEEKGPEDVKMYIASLDYLNGDYTKCLNTINKIKETSPQLSLLKGKCYFGLGNMEKAAEFFDGVDIEGKELSAGDRYDFGYAYFKINKHEKAVKWLKYIAFKGDSVSQQAAYLLGRSYLALDQKRDAFNSFDEAYRASLDPAVAEDALFNQAKLAVELSDPSSNSLLQKFIENYPKSANNREIKKLLTLQLLNSDNYKDAVVVLESLESLDAQEKEIYQKVTLARGKELYKNRNWNEAIQLFDKCIEQQLNGLLSSEAKFWKAEAALNKEDYNLAANTYQSFLNDGKTSLPIYSLAYYGYGYSQYAQKKYDVAAPYFKKFIDNLNSNNYAENTVNDAYLRLGDCNFSTRNYAQAIQSYAYVTSRKGFDADYALYQSGILYGLTKPAQTDQKISVLKRLIQEHPKSQFIPDAYYELGVEYWAKDNYREATSNFMYLVDDYKGNALVMLCYNNLGRIYENTNKPDMALDMFSRLYDEYPGTPEARTAADNVKRIYSSQGKPEKFVNWLTSRGGKMSVSEKDSLLYNSAYEFYDQEDCQRAIEGFDKYLIDLPNGSFAISSNYYKAMCHQKLKQNELAILHYKNVANANGNEFQEDATLAILELYGTKAACSDILPYLEKMETLTKSRDIRHKSWRGMMRCHDESKDGAKVIEVANKIVSELTTTDELKAEALVKIAKWEYQMGKKEEAKLKFQEVVKKYNNQYAAEAKYRLAFALFEESKFIACQDACYEVLDFYSGYDFWFGKSMLLLGDAYLAADDELNAKATWQRVVELFTESEIVTEAKTKLSNLKK